MGKPDAGVDGYIARQPSQAHPVLKRVRSIVRQVLPKAEETISYQIPTYRLHGLYVVYFAGWKRHWSLYPVTERTRQALGPALAAYEYRKGTVRFPLIEPVPTRLVRRIVRALAAAAGERSQARARTQSRRPSSARCRRRFRRTGARAFE